MTAEKHTLSFIGLHLLGLMLAAYASQVNPRLLMLRILPHLVEKVVLTAALAQQGALLFYPRTSSE